MPQPQRGPLAPVLGHVTRMAGAAPLKVTFFDGGGVRALGEVTWGDPRGAAPEGAGADADAGALLARGHGARGAGHPRGQLVQVRMRRER